MSFRFLLVTCERGALVANPHARIRRYCGKPIPGPVWGPNEQPIAEVVQDDPGLRKAHKGPDGFKILAETVAKDLENARAILQPAKSVEQKTGKAPKGNES